jgi:hypothetical protein
MTPRPIFASRREGLISLIWAVSFFIFLIVAAWHSSEPPSQLFFLLVMLFGWWGGCLPLAISAARRGDLPDRFFAILTLIGFVCFTWFMVSTLM